MPRSWHSSTSYLSFSADRVAADVADVAARLVPLAAARAEHLAVAVRVGHQRGAAVARTASAGGAGPTSLPHLHSQLPIEYSMNSSEEFSRKSLIGKTDLNTDCSPASSRSRRQTVHLQEALVGLLLDLDQVRDRDGRLDLREVDALAVDVLGKAVHAQQVLSARRRGTSENAIAGRTRSRGRARIRTLETGRHRRASRAGPPACSNATRDADLWMPRRPASAAHAGRAAPT